MSYFRLFTTFLRVGVLNELQFRANFFVQLWQSVLQVFGGLVSLAIVFAQTSNLNGWTRPELMAVMGIHVLVGGLIKTAIQPNMERLIADVDQGTLDYALTKPEDSQVLVSVRETRIWMMTDVLVGAAVIVWAVVQLHEVVGWLDALAFVVALFLGALMLYAIWLMLTSIAFWAVRVFNILEIFQGIYQTGRWPVGIYPDTLKYGLTFLVPIAFAITVPAEALTRRPDPLFSNPLLVAAGVAVGLLVAARIVWTIALRRYSGASA